MIIFTLKNEIQYIGYSSILITVACIFFYLITNITPKIDYDNINKFRGLSSPSSIRILSLQTKYSLKIGSQKGYQIEQISPKEASSYFSSYSSYDFINNYLKGTLVVVSQGNNKILFFDRSAVGENNILSITVQSSMVKNALVYLQVPSL